MRRSSTGAHRRRAACGPARSGTAPAAVFAARFPDGLNGTALCASAMGPCTSEPMLSSPAIGGGRGIFAAGASGLVARWGGVWAIQSVQRADGASAAPRENLGAFGGGPEATHRDAGGAVAAGGPLANFVIHNDDNVAAPAARGAPPPAAGAAPTLVRGVGGEVAALPADFAHEHVANRTHS
eukprot:g5777.t1